MLKYILKRLFISILVLLGFSVIIYSLVRMMSTDYLDNKFSAQLASGAINEEDLYHFKELYGIADNSFGGIVKGYFSWLVIWLLAILVNHLSIMMM